MEYNFGNLNIFNWFIYLLFSTLINKIHKFSACSARDTHQIAEAQQQKNAKLREAFNISEYFVEGSSFDSDRKAKEDLAKSVALQKELDAQRESLAAAAAAAAAGKDKETGKRYALVRTPSRERERERDRDGGDAVASGDEREHVSKSDKKKRKKRARERCVKKI